MGQQQLMLIVLGIIIVGIAVAVGINLFASSAVDANRDAVISDIITLGARAQQHYKKPSTMGGGSKNFNKFALGSLDTINANGQYRCTVTLPTSSDLITAGNEPVYAPISTSATTIYVVGYGTETGRDGTNLVMVYATVTPPDIDAVILN